MKSFLLLLTCTCLTDLLTAQTVIPLYDSILNAKPAPDREKSDTAANGIVRISEVSRPTLLAFLPSKEKATGTAIIICPGGGYSRLAFSHEGYEVAKYFNELGIAAFVLKYRLPDDAIMIHKEIGPVQDAQRAIQIVRERAGEWHLNKKRIGIIGFSAGGHLASTAGTHFNQHYIEVPKRTNLRPDFMILAYPVISFADTMTHMGSRTRLIGDHPSAEKIREYSNELQVTRNTPPTFLMHAKDDKVVSVQNSLHFYQSLQAHKVPAEIYLYEKGGHGFGMKNGTSEVKWMELVTAWMKKYGW